MVLLISRALCWCSWVAQVTGSCGFRTVKIPPLFLTLWCEYHYLQRLWQHGQNDEHSMDYSSISHLWEAEYSLMILASGWYTFSQKFIFVSGPLGFFLKNIFDIGITVNKTNVLSASLNKYFLSLKKWITLHKNVFKRNVDYCLIFHADCSM